MTGTILLFSAILGRGQHLKELVRDFADLGLFDHGEDDGLTPETRKFVVVP